MKKLCLLVVFILLVPVNVFGISASSYVVLDQNSNTVLSSYNMNDERLIASITKIMTAIVVIENVDLNKEVTVTEEVLKAYGSAIYIEVGEKITIEELLYGLMLRSGNDAAIVLATEVAGSMEKFALLMNEKVKELELENTIFVNSHGLEESDGSANYSSAYDMAIITSYAMKNSDYRKISGTDNITVETSYKKYTWDNKNKLLGQYDYITGGKTGYTEKAKRTLVTTASKNNMDIIVVTLNDGNDFEDHITLYESIFNSYEAIKVIDKDLTSINHDDNTLYVKNDYYALVKIGDEKQLRLEYEVFDEKVGTVSGLVKVYYNEKLLYTDELFEKEVEKNFIVNIWDKIIGWFKSW